MFLDYFKNLFKKKEVKSNVEVENITYVKFDPKQMEFIYKGNNYVTEFMYFEKEVSKDFDVFLSNYDKNKKNVFFLDNYEDISIVITAFINKISRELGRDARDDYNFFGVFGINSVRELCRLELLKKVKVDIAVLDLTLEEIVRDKGMPVTLDGIDVAINILEENKDAEVYFLTSHTLSTKVPTLKKFYSKYEQYIGKGEKILSDVYINKSKFLKDGSLTNILYRGKDI